MLYRKIAVASSLLIIIFLLYLIPTNNLEVSPNKQILEYVDYKSINTAYLLNDDDYLVGVNIGTLSVDINDISSNLIEAMVIDGKNKDIIPRGLRSLIPKNTKVLNLELRDKILYINFSKEFYNLKKEDEEKIVEALVYSLTSIDGIEKISISIDGSKLRELPFSKKILPEYLDRNFGINKEYEISTLNNIDSYTLYYVSNINDELYYVPVTKYLDKKNDKIKVIIDELASSLIYETNLMSFLDSNAKLLDYEINDDNVILNFNSFILSDMESNQILEEVVYTIGLSITDEYLKDEVIFKVNDEEITTFSKKMLD